MGREINPLRGSSGLSVAGQRLKMVKVANIEQIRHGPLHRLPRHLRHNNQPRLREAGVSLLEPLVPLLAQIDAVNEAQRIAPAVRAHGDDAGEMALVVHLRLRQFVVPLGELKRELLIGSHGAPHSCRSSRRLSSIALIWFCRSATRSRCCCTTSGGALLTKPGLASFACALWRYFCFSARCFSRFLISASLSISPLSD